MQFPISARLVCGVPVLLLAVACGTEADTQGDTLQQTETPQNQQGPGPVADAGPVGDASLPAPTGDPEANTLTLYAIPAPTSATNKRGVNWDSPGELVRSGLLNEAQGLSRAIGHVAVNVQCAKTSSLPANRYISGQSNVSQNEFKDLLLNDQVGLGMLFETVRGELESEALVLKTVNERKASGAMSFVRFQVSEAVCRGLLGYAKAYKAEGVQKNYGLAVRPLYKEGAGCSAYGMSYLQLANLVEPRFAAAWSFQVRVPKWLAGTRTPLVGGRLNPGAKVPVTRLTALSQPWASPTEEGYDLFGWDPTLMHNWIVKRVSEAKADGSEPTEALGKAVGLVLDRRTVRPTEALENKTYFQAL